MYNNYTCYRELYIYIYKYYKYRYKYINKWSLKRYAMLDIYICIYIYIIYIYIYIHTYTHEKLSERMRERMTIVRERERERGSIESIVQRVSKASLLSPPPPPPSLREPGSWSHPRVSRPPRTVDSTTTGKTGGLLLKHAPPRNAL